MTDELVTVTQSDRDAAAHVRTLFATDGDWSEGAVSVIRQGRMDTGSLVQAFARHRFASVSASGDSDEAAHLQTIDERDALHEALSDAYRAVCGAEPKWSNQFSYNDALDDIRAAVASPAISKDMIADIRRLCAEGTEGHGDEFYGPIVAVLDRA